MSSLTSSLRVGLSAIVLGVVLLPAAASGHVIVRCLPDEGPIRCTRLPIVIELSQFIRWDPRPECPECGRIIFIDIPELSTQPVDALLESLPAKMEASSVLSSVKVPGVTDDPQVPNLVLSYVGRDKIVGPAELGELKLRPGFALPPNVQYVARAFDTGSGEIATNVGAIALINTTHGGPDWGGGCWNLGLGGAVIALVVAVGVWWLVRRRRLA